MEKPEVRKHVLVAEDDPTIGALLVRLLRTRYDVTLVEDGRGALARAAENPPPDVLLLDVMMPGLDGFAVAQQARLIPALKHVPIIFITAKDAPADVIKGIQLGARNYITKPFKVDDVLAKVKKALGKT
jgi:DNA-binding response OmpR family regulator